MAINLQSLSITQTIQSIISFFRSQENNSKWKDLTTGAEGLFLIRMLANIITNISYRLVSARRENYITTANLLSSVTGIAVNYTYSVFRGTNQKRLIRLVPNASYTLPKFTVLGTYDDTHFIYNLEDIVLQKDVSIDVKVVIGTLNEISWVAGTTSIKQFQQFTSGISEDYVLYMDGAEVPTSKYIKDLVNDKYLVRTNPYSSVDVLYLNNATSANYTYGTESTFNLKYIELEDVSTISFTSDMFTYGSLTNTLTIENFVPYESVSSIKNNAPLAYEIQNVIRAKVDFINDIPQKIANIKVANYKTLTPSYTLLTYLKNDYSLLSDSEMASIESFISPQEFFGTPLPDIEPPKRDIVDLNITLKLNTRFKETSDIEADITAVLQTYYSTTLNQTFSTYDLERFIENTLTYVNYARISYNVINRANSTNYQLGTITEINSTYYRADKVLGITGTSEPNWNLPVQTPTTIDTGLETVDNGIIWKAYKMLPSLENSISTWSPNEKIYVSQFRKSANYPYYMFKCVDLVKYSGTSTPSVTNISVGDFLFDNKIVWVCITYNISFSAWEVSTPYRLGDCVNIGTLSFQCISYTGNSGISQPIFEIDKYPIVSTSTSSFTVSGDYTAYFKAEDIIKASTSENTFTFSVKNSEYNGVANQTIINVNQIVDITKTYNTLQGARKGTQDGELVWQIEDNITEVTYNWNVYNIFSYTLTTTV
jgi:hypothetical protein